MQVGNFRSREALCLGAGVLLGITATLGFRPFAGTIPPAGRVTSPPAVAIPVPPTASEDPPTRPFRRTARADGTASSSDWARVAAEYTSPNGDFSQAQNLLHGLDRKALRRLGASVRDWPLNHRTTRAVRDLFHRWAAIDPQGAFAQAQALGEPLVSTALYEGMKGFAEGQPAEAAAYFAAPPSADDRYYLHDLGWRRSLLNQALANWSEQDAPAVVNFLGNLPPGTLYPGPAYAVAQEWARQDPAAALNWATHLGDRDPRSSALDGVIATWTETNPQAALNYVLGQSADPSQGALVATLAEKWAERDLPGAARWATEQSGSLQSKAAAAVVRQWASNDPAGAAAWASQLSGEALDSAYATLGDTWGGSDPGAARGWLAGLPAGAARDAAIGNYLEDYQNSDVPTEKLAWAGKIVDGQKRDEVKVKILNDWLNNTPQAARQWISQANLPEAVTGKLKGG